MQPSNFARILIITLALGTFSWWALAQRDARPGRLEAGTVIEAPTGIRLLRLTEAKELWHDPATLFVDVRPQADYEIGRIAGAVALPEDELEQRLPTLRSRLARAHTLVLYCTSRDCGKSLWAAIRLRNQGLTQAVIFPGGWNEWYNAGLPVTRSEP